MTTVPTFHALDRLRDAGLTVTLTPDNGLKVTPSSILTQALRDVIRAGKDVLVDRLRHEAANDLNTATANGPAHDRTEWCWPHSIAMNGREINTFTARLDWFFYRGLALPDAESLANKLVIRDRENDDRRLCLECLHLGGNADGSWRCTACQAAGIAIQARDARLPCDLVHMLQRCNGFMGVL